MLQGILLAGTPLLLAVAPAASPCVNSAAALTMATGAAAALQSTGLATTLHTAEAWQAFYATSYMVRTSSSFLASSMDVSGMRSADHLHRKAHEACHLLQQAALEAVCGATPPKQLLAHDALQPAWQAAASTLQLCSEVMLYTTAPCITFCARSSTFTQQVTICPGIDDKTDLPVFATQWLNSEQTKSRLATEAAVEVAEAAVEFAEATVDIAELDTCPTPEVPRCVILDDVSQAIAKVCWYADDRCATQTMHCRLGWPISQ